jgi:hypothetical protein
MMAAVKIAENSKFEKVKPQGKTATVQDSIDTEMIDPEVYFTGAKRGQEA